MPKSTNASTSTVEKIQEESCTHEESSSTDQEQDPEVFFQPSQAQVVPIMFMLYIEGSKMDWTVNDGLYHRFLKRQLLGTSSRWQVTPDGSDQFDETSAHRPPSRQAQEEEVLC